MAGSQEWKSPQGPAHRGAVAHRRQADGHERAAPGQVRLADGDVRDRCQVQTFLEPRQRRLVGGGEHDRVRSRRQPPRARLSGGVRQLGSEHTEREVPTDDAVVVEPVERRKI